MIEIKDLTVKNFMSVGNVSQAVNFSAENLTLVLGENLDQGGDDNGSRNGTGKTTIVNALSYALYGIALTNIKKDNLINKINNKNMLVTLTLSKDGVDYKIERGRKPNIFNFTNISDTLKNQESDSQGESKDTQKDIEDLIGMSHDMFKHVLALNTYTEPFLSMRAGDQRMIIEQLLGIMLLSEKSTALGIEIKKTKDLIFQENANLEATKKANEKIQQSIDTLVMSQRAWNAKHNKDLENIALSIVELESLDIDVEIQTHNDIKLYDEKSNKIKSLSKEKATLDSAISQSDKQVKKYTAELEDRKSTRLNSSHIPLSRMPSSA